MSMPHLDYHVHSDGSGVWLECDYYEEGHVYTEERLVLPQPITASLQGLRQTVTDAADTLAAHLAAERAKRMYERRKRG